MRHSVTTSLRHSVTPSLRYSVTTEVTFFSNDVTDRYFLFTGNGPSNGSDFLAPLLRYFLLRCSIILISPLISVPFRCICSRAEATADLLSFVCSRNKNTLYGVSVTLFYKKIAVTQQR